jgi:hypothetical protein
MANGLSCGRADFSGSTKSVAQSLTQEEPTIGFESQMTTVSMALNVLQAPRIRLPKVSIFNSNLFINLDCNEPKHTDGFCGSNDESDPEFALRDLRLGFVSINQSVSLLSQIDYDRIKSLNFDITQEFRPRPEGGVEVGPLKIYLPKNGDRVGVVIRRQVDKEGKKLESFKVFLLN